MAACPMLAELTIYPYQYDAIMTEEGFVHDPIGKALSAISGLVIACEALPDFDTLQIVYNTFLPPCLECWCGPKQCGSHALHREQWEQSLKEQAKGMKDVAVDCFKKSKAGCQERDGRKKITVRVVRLSSARSYPLFHPDVEDYRV